MSMTLHGKRYLQQSLLQNNLEYPTFVKSYKRTTMIKLGWIRETIQEKYNIKDIILILMVSFCSCEGYIHTHAYFKCNIAGRP